MKFYLKDSKKKGTKSSPDSNRTPPKPKLIMGKLYDAQFAPEGRFVYSTGERITEKAWNGGKLKRGHEALRIRLNKISTAAAEYIRLHRESLTREGLKEHLDGLRPKVDKRRGPKTLLQHWSDYLEAISGTISWKTLRNYRNSYEILEAFLKANAWSGITADRFTVAHLKRFQGYLNSPRKDAEGKELPAFRLNQQAKVLKHFKASLLHLTKLKEPIGFDLDELTYKEKPGLKISLTEEKLQAFIDADLTGREDKIRDLFVVQCSLGPRVSDLQRLDQNIQGNKIVLEMQKTEKVVEIPITPHARKILEKYNYQLPRISEQKYRLGIKAIYKKLFPNDVIQIRDGSGYRTVPVHEEISSHDAVRTFVTLSAERGVSVNSIAKITGKTVKILIENYLVESQKIAEQEMEKAWGASPLKVAR